MNPTTVAVLGIVLMFVLMMLRVPVAFAMLLAGVIGNAYLLTTGVSLHIMATNVWGQFASYSLSVVPLFVLMGQITFHSGVTERLYNAAHKWVGRLPGGLAATTILASMGFAAICGSNSATAATMGTVALPEMKRYKYDGALSTGAVAIGGTLGVVIPPSVVLIIIAVQTEQSIVKLFLANIIPGVLLTALLLMTVFIVAFRNPALGPPAASSSWKEKFISLAGVIEAIALFALVIGGLYAGWFTPTQAGAAGAFGAIIIGFARRTLSLKGLQLAIGETLRTSAMVVLLITGAVLFGKFLTVTRLPFDLAEWATALPIPPIGILGVVVLIYLVGGALMDALGFLVATIPIFFPLAVALGYDPIWFTVVLTLVTTMGAVTPPVGVNVYIVSGLVPDIPIQTIFRGVMVFLIAYVVVLLLLVVFPQLALFLPNSL